MKNLVWLGAKLQEVSTTAFKAAYSYKNDVVYYNRETPEDIFVHENVHKWQYATLDIMNIDKDIFYSATRKIPTLARLHEALAREVQYGQMTLAESLEIFVRANSLDRMISWSVKMINKTIDILSEKHGDISSVTIYNHGIAIDTTDSHFAYDLIPYHAGTDIKDRTDSEAKFGKAIISGTIADIKNYFENIRKEVITMTTIKDNSVIANNVQNNNNNVSINRKDDTIMANNNNIALFGIKTVQYKDGTNKVYAGGVNGAHLISSAVEQGNNPVFWQANGNVIVNGEIKAEFVMYVSATNKHGVTAQLNAFFSDVYGIGNKVIVDTRDREKSVPNNVLKGIWGPFISNGTSYQVKGYQKIAESLSSDTLPSRVYKTPAKRNEEITTNAVSTTTTTTVATVNSDNNVSVDEIVNAVTKVFKAEIASLKDDLKAAMAEIVSLKAEVAALKAAAVVTKEEVVAENIIEDTTEVVTEDITDTSVAVETAPVVEEQVTIVEEQVTTVEEIPTVSQKPEDIVATNDVPSNDDDFSLDDILAGEDISVNCDNDPAMGATVENDIIEEEAVVEEEEEEERTVDYSDLYKTVVKVIPYNEEGVLDVEDYKATYNRNLEVAIETFNNAMFSLFKNDINTATTIMTAIVKKFQGRKFGAVRLSEGNVQVKGSSRGKNGWFVVNNNDITFVK